MKTHGILLKKEDLEQWNLIHRGEYSKFYWRESWVFFADFSYLLGNFIQDTFIYSIKNSQLWACVFIWLEMVGETTKCP